MPTATMARRVGDAVPKAAEPSGADSFDAGPSTDGPVDAGAANTGPSEAAVQAMLVFYLVGQGWYIRRVADTATKERSIDILAVRDGRTLAVEVKGYPARRRYSDPARAGEVKPTHPATQARHWYSRVLLKAMLTIAEHPDYSAVTMA